MSRYVDLDRIKGFEVELFLEKPMTLTAKETAVDLRENSPRGDNKRTKHYADTWRSRYNKITGTSVVYNQKNYRLTHLLENGHLIVNKKWKNAGKSNNGWKTDRVPGWSAPIPHIENAYLKAIDNYVKKMKKVEMKADFKKK